MFPIKDTIHSRSFPIITLLIIILNTLVFLYETSLSETGLEQFVYTFGLVPARLTEGSPFAWMTLFSHMFLHGGWSHILSNMWMLFIFGDNVEDRMGSGRFLLFYLFGGVAAGIMQMMLGGDPNMPSIGASGAIAAVMGAYFLFFPHSSVITFVPIFFIWFINVPSIIYLGIWFISQLFSGITSLALPSGTSAGGIAWWAHIGGFAFGLVLALYFKARQRPPVVYRDEYYPW